eukprot:g2984.t1
MPKAAEISADVDPYSKVDYDDLSPYLEFRRAWMTARYKKLKGTDPKEVTRLVKAAWREKKERELKKARREREVMKRRKREEKLSTPYSLFRFLHLKKIQEQLKGKEPRIITANVKKAWQETTPYMRFRLQYLISHREELQGKKDTEVTAIIKAAFKTKKEESKEKERMKLKKKKKKKKKGKKKTPPKKKGRKKEVLLAAFPNKHKIKRGELLSPYIYFRAGFFSIHNKDMRGKSRKEQTATVKEAWKKQQDELNEARRIYKLKEQTRKRRYKAKKSGKPIRPGDEKQPRTRMSKEDLKARKKNIVTPYQYFRVGYARLHDLDIANNPKEHTKEIKAAWASCKMVASEPPRPNTSISRRTTINTAGLTSSASASASAPAAPAASHALSAPSAGRAVSASTAPASAAAAANPPASSTVFL